MNELHDKTPQQLNMMVAEIKFPDFEAYENLNGKACGVRMPRDIAGREGEYYIKKFDWINDDALAFRLMVDNGICITAESMSNLDESYWWASEKIIVEECGGIDCGVNSWNKNPSRAIAETFILMNQHKEG